MMTKLILGAVLGLALFATTAEAAQKWVLTYVVANGTIVDVKVIHGFATQALCQARAAKLDAARGFDFDTRKANCRLANSIRS